MEKRILQHKTNTYKESYTGKYSDWILVFKIEHLEYSTARKIEKHIKKMKSRKYIESLLVDNEKVKSLVTRFNAER